MSTAIKTTVINPDDLREEIQACISITKLLLAASILNGKSFLLSDAEVMNLMQMVLDRLHELMKGLKE